MCTKLTEVLTSGTVWHLKFKDQMNHISHAERKISQLKKVQAEASCHCQQVWMHDGNYTLIFFFELEITVDLCASYVHGAWAGHIFIDLDSKENEEPLFKFEFFKVWQPWEFMWRCQQKLQKFFRGIQALSFISGNIEIKKKT